jgi:hypothetical protein
MKLYHVTTPKKAKAYRQTGHIIKPVRGFTTPTAALAWACGTGRTVILEFESNSVHKLPDHHNKYGEAWWADENIANWRCEYSAGVKLSEENI